MQRVGGAVIGLLLGAMLAALVLLVLWIAWFALSMLALADLAIAKSISNWVVEHAACLVAATVVLCCGVPAVHGYRKGMRVYTKAEF